MMATVETFEVMTSTLPLGTPDYVASLLSSKHISR